MDALWKPRKDQKTIMTLIGDGRSEKNILPSIFERYNGNNILNWCPWLTRTRTDVGFSALRGIKQYPIYRTPNNFLFVVDKEHLEGDSLEEKVGHTFRGPFQIIDINSLSESAIVVKYILYHREKTAYAVVMGKVKYIEECLSEFFEREMGLNLSPTKDIWVQLKGHGIKSKHIKEIILKADMRNLSMSFPNLDLALTHIEQNI